MNLKKALRTSNVVSALRNEAADALRNEAVRGVVYARVSTLLAEARAAAAEAEAVIEEAGEALVEAEAEEERVRAEHREAIRLAGEEPGAESDAALKDAQLKKFAVQELAASYRHTVSTTKLRLEKLQELEAALAAIEEPDLGALRQLSAMI